MNFAKKFWPISFKVKKGNLVSFLLYFFVYVVVCFVFEKLAQFVAPINVLGTILYVLYVVVDVYSVVGVVLCIFQLFGIKKLA